MLDAAVQVFSHSGYHAASMDEIAEVAGVSKPMLYLYLGSKEELFIGCIRREAARLLERIAAAVAESTTLEERLAFGLEAFFAYVAEHADSWSVLYHRARTLGSPFADEVSTARQEIIDAVTGLVGDRRPTGKGAEALAYALVGAADALAEWAAADGPGESPKETTARMMNLFWIGMERQITGDRWSPA